MTAPPRIRDDFEVGIGIAGALPAGDYAALGERIEQLGFATVSVFGDLMFQPPALPLTLMATRTRRLRLGLGAVNPFVQHPAEIAGQVAVLDDLSQGRAFLGLVRGAWLDRLGLAQRSPVTAIADTIEICDRLLAGDDGGYAGEVFQLAPGTTLRYAVHRPDVPLMIGTWSPRLAAVAGERAHEVKVGGSTNPDFLPIIRERIAVGTRAAGRAVDDVGLVLGAVTVVDEDGDAARRRARTLAAMYFEVVAGFDATLDVDPELLARMRALLDRGDDEGAGRLIPDALLDRFSYVGTPAEVVEQTLRIAEAGALRTEFGPPYGLTVDGGLTLLGTRVVPELRRRLGG